jgi:hypothetical protein
MNLIINKIILFIGHWRLKKIEFFKSHPKEAQEKVFWSLVKKARNTEWGKNYKYSDFESVADFQNNVPISRYEDLFPYIHRMMFGERNVLWPGLIRWFSRSSGTTNARSKYIPVSFASIKKIHFKGGKDVGLLYLNQYPDSGILLGRNVAIPGSLEKMSKKGIYFGDISAILIKNLPLWMKMLSGANTKTNLTKDWEEKAEKLAYMACQRDVRVLAGVPSWTAVLLKKFLEIERTDNLFDIWPNLELFVHGGTSLKPYQHLFDELIPSGKIRYMEAYNASEGFFAIQDDLSMDDMLLMLDYGVFFEFIPLEEIGKEKPKALTLDKVEIDRNYAIVISTNSGLWRYMIGDTVKFTSLEPFKIKITGRTRSFINTFGEELMVENAEVAIAEAMKMTDSTVHEFTAAPVIISESGGGFHEWVIEFEKEPKDFQRFKKVLDLKLREVNSDYDAKRHKDLLLKQPLIQQVPRGTFYKWLKSKGKLGGQNKVPRLSNSREYIDDLMTMV